jgi:(p)ppGpp synthase/HD superfamily hydrolase
LYNRTCLSLPELEERLTAQNLDSIEINRVICAYELAESVHEFQVRNDGTPYFYHSSRVCKILLDELKIYEPEVLIAALLHDVLEDSEVITKGVLEHNFGQYVAYVVETLTKDLKEQEKHYDEIDLAHVEQLKKSSEDCILIRLAARLDNFRCLGYNLKKNPIKYIQQTTERYLPLAENSKNKHLQYIVKEIKKERNKFLG